MKVTREVWILFVEKEDGIFTYQPMIFTSQDDAVEWMSLMKTKLEEEQVTTHGPFKFTKSE